MGGLRDFMAQILKDNHPDKKKFEKAMDAMHKNGVRIEFYGHRTYVIIGDNKYDIEDFEDSSTISEFPPIFEYKLVQGRE